MVQFKFVANFQVKNAVCEISLESMRVSLEITISKKQLIFAQK
jgi:hypothetical protein